MNHHYSAPSYANHYHHHHHHYGDDSMHFRSIHSGYPSEDDNDDDSMERVASFLLTLKHRSVTPEPPSTNSNDELSLSKHYKKNRQHSSYHDYPAHPDEAQSSQSECRERTPSLTEEHSVSDDTTSSASLENLLGDSKLVRPQDRDLVPDALFVAMAQMKPCKLTQSDRVGCYKSRDIGFIGMCCKHCEGQPGFGRYYPNSVRSLAQTTTSQTILKHVGSKCRRCPRHIRQAVLDLQQQQAAREGTSTAAASSSGRPRYGSRKIFFQRVWERLHGETDDEESQAQTTTTATTARQHHQVSQSEDDSSSTTSSTYSEDYEHNRQPRTIKRKSSKHNDRSTKRARHDAASLSRSRNNNLLEY